MRYLALFLLLALGVGHAHATTIEEAYATCQTRLGTLTNTICENSAGAGWTVGNKQCEKRPQSPTTGDFLPKATCSNGAGSFPITANAAGYDSMCPSGSTWSDTTHSCRLDCVAGQTSSGVARKGTNLDTCNPAGCTVTWTADGAPYVVLGSDGVPWTWQRWNGVSTTEHCVAGTDTDDDGHDDTDDNFPTDPNEHVDTDGDGIGDNADAMPNDPTNGEDNGDGTEVDNTSSGGGTCANPPVSSGDGILSMIAYQTWNTRCAIEKLNAALTGNGTGTAPGPGTGTDMTATNNKLDTINESIKDLTDVTGADPNAGNGDGVGEPSASDVIGSQIYGEEAFDRSGFGWGSTCPDMPTLDIGGQTIDLDASGLFCDWMTAGGYFVLLIAGLACLRILWSA